ncbi:MAG: hypothetical protein M3Q10_02485, partial [Chloroflexota bacterium]|nr:hypothetical protein [Chloroflexota bacterium]
LGRGPTLPRGWRPPPREEWAPILEATPLDVFANRAGVQYYFAALLRTFGAGTEHDLAGIPFEEQVVLLTVRDLAAWHHVQRAARERAGGAS